jgi:hypothetical protein
MSSTTGTFETSGMTDVAGAPGRQPYGVGDQLLRLSLAVRCRLARAVYGG